MTSHARLSLTLIRPYIDAGLAEYRLLDPGLTLPSSAAADFGNVSLGMEFYVDEACQATKAWFYQAGSNTTARMAYIWHVNNGSAGTLLGSVSIPATGGNGWKSAVFASPIDLYPGQRYRVVVYHPGGEYSATSGFWSGSGEGASGRNNGLLHAPNSTDAVANDQGSYVYGSGIDFPTDSFGAANYWSDVTVQPFLTDEYRHYNLQRRWDASALTGLSDGDAIHPWADVHAAADMSQLTIANRPTYKVNIRNGLAVARFDAGDWMESAPCASGATTIALVRKVASTGGTYVQAWHGDGFSGGGPIIYSGNKAAYLRNVAIPQDSTATTGWERWILCMSAAGGAGSTRLYVDGVEVINDSGAMNGISGLSTVCRLGASDGGTQTSGSPFQNSGGMDLGEALFFDASLNSTEAAELDAYLAEKWG